MSDNPRVAPVRCEIHCGACQPALARPDEQVTVAGRHCESGDEIARDVELPADIHPGDLLAVACTGAYQHSMASNYNMVGRPPIVAVRHGRGPELVRRETVADLLARDRGWSGGAVRFTTSTPVGSTPTVTGSPGAERPRPRAGHLRADHRAVLQGGVHPRDRSEERHRADRRRASRVGGDGDRLRPHHRQPRARGDGALQRGTEVPSRCACPPETSAGTLLFRPTNSATNGVAGLA